MVENTNPLSKYFRQPSVYVGLPSGGNYPPTVMERSQTGEIGVQPMTARDEVIFKTPDALMNGQGVVDVIQSCIPQIKDAWQLINYDLDTVFIAIRIATYGETMNIEFKNYPVHIALKYDHLSSLDKSKNTIEEHLKVQNSSNAFIYKNTIKSNSGYGIYLLINSDSANVKYNTLF